VFRFVLLPAGLLGFLYRLYPGDIALTFFAVAIVVSWLGAWILGSTEAAQEQRGQSRLRIGLGVTVAMMAPPVIPFAVLTMGKAYLLFSVALLAFYFVTVQWFTRNQLSGLTLAMGYLSIVGLLSGVFTLPSSEMLVVSLVYAGVCGLVSVLLVNLLTQPPGPNETTAEECNLTR